MLQYNEVESKYNELLKAKGNPIKENSIVQSHLKWIKAVNDLSLAEGLLKISTNPRIKDALGCPKQSFF
jgi:hypothetical protein